MSHTDRLDLCVEKQKHYDAHIKESIPVRDDVRDLKKAVSALKTEVQVIKSGVMKSAVIGGIVGALIGSGSPEVLKPLISALAKFIT